MEPTLRVLSLETDRQRRASLLGAGLLTAVAIAVFGVAGLVLAAVGILGQIANEIAGQARSLAIRAALGASPAALRREGVRRVGAAALGGTALGLGLLLLLSRFLSSRMDWVDTADPLPYALSAAAALLGCATGAFLIRPTNPARVLQTT